MKINIKDIGDLNISQKDHDCFFSRLNQTQATEYKHISNDNDELLYFFTNKKGVDVLTTEEEGNEPLMNHVLKFNNGDPVMNNDSTVEKWVQNMYATFSSRIEKFSLKDAQAILDEKINNCKKPTKGVVV